jgi:hypothetical protein
MGPGTSGGEFCLQWVISNKRLVVCLLVCFVVLRTDPKALCMLDKHTLTSKLSAPDGAF